MGINMQSNTSMTYKEELLNNLKNEEYRKAFVESHINNGIAFQIRTMRNNRNLNQEALGNLAGMKQEAICRLENPNYGSFTLKTLKEIAAAFDVALIVRFVPFSDLVKWDLNLSEELLDVSSFNKDTYFTEGVGEDEKYLSSGISSDLCAPKSNIYDFNDFRKKQSPIEQALSSSQVTRERPIYNMVGGKI